MFIEKCDKCGWAVMRTNTHESKQKCMFCLEETKFYKYCKKCRKLKALSEIDNDICLECKED